MPWGGGISPIVVPGYGFLPRVVLICKSFTGLSSRSGIPHDDGKILHGIMLSGLGVNTTKFSVCNKCIIDFNYFLKFSRLTITPSFTLSLYFCRPTTVPDIRHLLCRPSYTQTSPLAVFIPTRRPHLTLHSLNYPWFNQFQHHPIQQLRSLLDALLLVLRAAEEQAV